MAVVYLTEQGSVLKKVNKRLIVTKEKEKLLDIPAIKVTQIVIVGNSQLTTQAVSFCLSQGIDVVYLSRSGRFKGRLQPDYSRDVSIRQAQFLCGSKQGFRLKIAKKIVIGKIHNSILLCKAKRPFFSNKKIKEGIKQLERYKKSITENKIKSLDHLRGTEGKSSAVYFDIYRELLKEKMGFKKRIKHPPPDPINILLSLGYTLLYNNVFAMVHLVGLDPYQGFYHTERHGHASLASDMMEEFRAPIADNLVLTLINKRIITSKHFEKDKDRHIRLTTEGFKRFVVRYNDQIEKKVKYKLEGKSYTVFQCMELQLRQLVKVLQGKEKEYDPIEIG